MGDTFGVIFGKEYFVLRCFAFTEPREDEIKWRVHWLLRHFGMIFEDFYEGKA